MPPLHELGSSPIVSGPSRHAVGPLALERCPAAFLPRSASHLILRSGATKHSAVLAPGCRRAIRAASHWEPECHRAALAAAAPLPAWSRMEWGLLPAAPAAERMLGHSPARPSRCHGASQGSLPQSLPPLTCCPPCPQACPAGPRGLHRRGSLRQAPELVPRRLLSEGRDLQRSDANAHLSRAGSSRPSVAGEWRGRPRWL